MASTTTRITARTMMTASVLRTSIQHGSRDEVRADLALHPLQGVVDRLGIACESPGDLLVGATVQVERQGPGLELGERRGQAPDECLELLGGDDLQCRVVHGGAGDDLLEGRLALGRARGRLRERDVAVERRVLVARRRL